MAKKHTRKRGKSGSKRPITNEVPDWVSYSPEEVEDLVIKYAKEGYDSTTIGLILRDDHGIPSVKNITKRTISQILKENNLTPDFPDDILKLIAKAVKMREHLASNKQDISNKKKLIDTESKINALAKYYRGKGRIPKNWKYDPENAKLLVK